MKKLNIIHEDKNIIVINKPNNYLTIGTDKDKIHNLYHEVREYLYKKNQKVFIVHRLDKDTSGVLVFAKNEATKRRLQDHWDDYIREYRVVVHGKVKDDKKRIVEYLKENKEHMVYTSHKGDGQIAVTNYEVLKRFTKVSYLKVLIETGRKNQIRVALANLDHPILGDKKYGLKDKAPRMFLHAYKLVIDGNEYIAKLPKEFEIYE
jgi:tRNA pseudouridine32 synthase/23S rRNA pseudouridine746 synthase/23S rRNA pseudouridine1911/1915/1917 synthase